MLKVLGANNKILKNIATVTLLAMFVVAPLASVFAEVTITFHHPDHLGGAHIDTNEKGEVVNTIDYKPYGPTNVGTTTSTPEKSLRSLGASHQYTGQVHDEDTGLYYYNARYYHLKIGRFISQDPWSGDIADPQSLNKYSYVKNNPLRYVDPSGECANEAGLVAGCIETGLGFHQGATSGAKATSEAMSYAMKHPIQAVKGLATAVFNPIDTVNSIIYSEKQAFESAFIGSNGDIGKYVGERTFGIGALLMGGGGSIKSANYLKRFQSVSNLTRVQKNTIEYTLDRIGKGEAHRHFRDGKTYFNKPHRDTGKRLLPTNNDSRYYSEYVASQNLNSRAGNERIIIGKGGEKYFSPDHYDSAIKLD